MFPKDTRFLVIDDSPIARKLIRTELELMGYNTIAEAVDGSDALSKLEMAEESKQSIQFIICDVRMPNMDGVEFLKNVKGISNFMNIPILMLTSEGDTSIVMSAAAFGIDGYLLKPIDPEELLNRLQSIWKKKNKD